MAHVAEWKKEEVNELKGLIESAEVVGIVNLLNIPARQLQEMRKTLAGKATIRLSKINLMKLALEDCDNEKANITGLSDFMEGQPALVCTDMNPFRLYKILEDSKTSAPAKAGATAPDDIVVPAGDTGFPPGPFLGDLQQIGVPAKIDKGKIVVSKDTVVVEAGEEVSKQVAAALTRMDIKPMEVGMDLKAVYEELHLPKHLTYLYLVLSQLAKLFQLLSVLLIPKHTMLLLKQLFLQTKLLIC